MFLFKEDNCAPESSARYTNQLKCTKPPNEPLEIPEERTLTLPSTPTATVNVLRVLSILTKKRNLEYLIFQKPTVKFYVKGAYTQEITKACPPTEGALCYKAVEGNYL